ncbi:Uncharacterized protein Fot_02382 [Forsythia ovata]|uniref:Uncharacterized protein n=1 Tax=Forsythia ovata TaxID=205694 RepID=A0ABD1X9R9_9LAMI
MIGRLYSYRGDFYKVIGSGHLFMKHNLMKKQGSSTLPKIGLVDLAPKKIHPVVKKRSSDNEQKRLSLKSGEKNQDALSTPRTEKDKAKEVGSSKISVEDNEDVEVLDDVALTRKAKKPRISFSKSSQNLAAEVRESEERDKGTELQNLEGPDHSHLVRIREILEGEPSDINPEVFDMIPPHFQRVLTTIDSFWTHGWATTLLSLPLESS